MQIDFIVEGTIRSVALAVSAFIWRSARFAPHEPPGAFCKMTFRLFSAFILAVFSAGSVFAFDLQGHRGARGIMPENTLPAFAKALSIGVSTLELDTGLTRDGVVVVTHNFELSPDITRNADGNWIEAGIPVTMLSFAELKAFDVGRIKPGSRTASRFGTQQAVDGTSVPALSEVFQLVEKSGNSKVRFNIETKINPLEPQATADPETFAQALLDVIDEHGMASRVSIQSFDWRTLQIVQQREPEIETVYLTAQQDWLDNLAENDGRVSPWTAGFRLSDHDGSIPRLVAAAGGKVWSPYFVDLNREALKEAHDLGLKVIPWTVNDADMMRELVAAGVDGIITDYPDVLRGVLAKAGVELPVSTPMK